jgi:membrane protease YdiL (CAAX protease family)
MTTIEAKAPNENAVAQTKPYPTVKESWGMVGWYLLIILVLGVPFFLVLDQGLNMSRQLSSALMTVVINLSLLGFLRWKAGKRWQPIRLLGYEKPWLYAALLLLVPAWVMSASLLEFLHLPNWQDRFFLDLMQHPLTAFLTMVVAAPMLEEVLFRGIMLRGLLRSQQPWAAIGLSAALFGLIHFNPAQSLHAALFGVLLGWLYYRTQSLGVCIGVHALNNLLAFGGMLLPATREAESFQELVGSASWYSAAVLLSCLVLVGLLWRISQISFPSAAFAVAKEELPPAVVAGD